MQNGTVPADVEYALQGRLLEVAIFYGRPDTNTSQNSRNPPRLDVHSAAALHCLLEIALVHAPEAKLRSLIDLLIDSIPNAQPRPDAASGDVLSSDSQPEKD